MKINLSFLIGLLALLETMNSQSTKPIAGTDTNTGVKQTNLEFPPADTKLVDERTAQLSSAIDLFINLNIKMCTTCESLKFFGIKMGSNNAATLQYLTVSSACVGSLSFAVPGTSSGRPGNNQLFIATQLSD